MRTDRPASGTSPAVRLDPDRDASWRGHRRGALRAGRGAAITTANASGSTALELASGCTYVLHGSHPALVDAGNGPNGFR